MDFLKNLRNTWPETRLDLGVKDLLNELPAFLFEELYFESSDANRLVFEDCWLIMRAGDLETLYLLIEIR